jgi:hypothetical protein
MISFMPSEQDCQRNSNDVTNEFLFVVDCSGSMNEENKTGLARTAMRLFLKSVPVDCRIVILETRCPSSKTLWQAISNKTHKRLKQLLGEDEKKLEQMMQDIRDQFL